MNIADLIALPAEVREEAIAALSIDELNVLQYKWEFWARENQLAPGGEWTYWTLLAGRGFGKTRVGAEWIRKTAESGKIGRISLVAATNPDIRGVMVEGESGIMSISPPWFMPKYEPSKARITWPNGVIAQLFSAEEPDRLRGPQCGAFWADELAAWKNLDETWSNLQFGFRLGRHPQGVITTTPRPVDRVRDLVEMEKDGSCVVTRGSTYDNRQNLAAGFFKEVIREYEGTRLGKQELLGILLEDNPNALFTSDNIDKNRAHNVPHLDRIVVAIDPPVTANEKSAEAGIVVVGVRNIDDVKHYYVLADLSVEVATPIQWARKAAIGFYDFKADRVIAEANNGGDMVISTVAQADAGIPCEKVIATRGKTRRAEPVGALYEQNRVHHCAQFEKLENQMTSWDPTIPDDKQKSPDRMDALVWAITFLMEDKKRGMAQGSAQ